MGTYLWGPENSLIVPTPKIAFLMHDDDSGRCQMHQVGIPELSLINFAKKFEDTSKIFLDCGAHMGVYSLLLADHFYEVHAFEAQRRTYHQLCGNIFVQEKTNITPHHMGLTNSAITPGAKAKLTIVSEDGGGSTLEPIENQTIISSEEVPLGYIDFFEFPKNKIGLIKIDVEGHELQVISGALKTLQESGYPPIIFESNAGRENYSKRAELFTFIKNLGYTIIGLQPYENMFLAEYSS